MVEAMATATEMKNQFGKYLQMVINGNEVIITKNMKLLIDANVILDVLQKREPHYEYSAVANHSFTSSISSPIHDFTSNA